MHTSCVMQSALMHPTSGFYAHSSVNCRNLKDTTLQWPKILASYQNFLFMIQIKIAIVAPPQFVWLIFSSFMCIGSVYNFFLLLFNNFPFAFCFCFCARWYFFSGVSREPSESKFYQEGKNHTSFSRLHCQDNKL